MIIGTQRKCSYCHQSGHRKTYKGKITCPLYYLLTVKTLKTEMVIMHKIIVHINYAYDLYNIIVMAEIVPAVTQPINGKYFTPRSCHAFNA